MLMAIDPGALLVHRLKVSGAQPKRVAADIGYDAGHFSRGCAGLGPLDLHRLSKLDAGVFIAFLRDLAIAKIQDHFDQELGALRMAKADLPAHNERRRA